ncbi:coiled coil protein [Legionella sp. PATHC035]|uniref:coiled coil protein n=1 Tax=Legionella sp. PATHC035 TaxID=2992040 RepID=UPI0022435A57|nr:coiled coil protein [Legionella sp. PATHC035]MCW8408646.1 coiled coil protein [Legionella sp. PATHC035]
MLLLKHLLAILLGTTVLPLRVLVNNAFYAIAALFLGVAALIVLPMDLAYTLKDKGVSNRANLLITGLIFFPLLTAMTAVALAGIAVYLTFNTVVNMLESFWVGFKNGLLYGMDGFENALASQRLFNLIPSESVLRTGVNPEHAINEVDFNGFQRVNIEDLQDVPVARKPLDVPDLESKEGQASTQLLTENQLKQIQRLIDELPKLKDPLPPLAKQQFELLQKLHTQYQDLSLKLEKVRVALEQDDKSQIKDELIVDMEVDTPILLVKQYQDGQKWLNIPATSYVTDKDNLLNWLQHSPVHPLNKDLLKEPGDYNGKKTRYIWYLLTKDNCSSQELDEAAVQIRFLVNALSIRLTEKQKLDLGLGLSSQAFFAPVVQDNSELSQGNHQSMNFGSG